MPQVLALISAHGDSEAPTRANLRLLHGHPLIAWAIAAGRQSKLVTRTLCSTDDLEVGAAARKYGAEVQIEEPTDAETGAAAELSLYQRALRRLEREDGWRPEIVVGLRPSAPVRQRGQVDRVIQLLVDHPEAGAASTMGRLPCRPSLMWRLSSGDDSTMRMRRLLADLAIADREDPDPREALESWWRTGTIDATRAGWILGSSMTGMEVLPLPMDARLAVTIGDALDLHVAAALINSPGLECVRPGPGLEWGRVRLMVLDVDGTLTPGTMYYSPEGEALKRFHTHDGHGITMLREARVEVAIITREDSAFTTARARKLGIVEVHRGIKDKLTILRDLVRRRGIATNEVAYVGDDVGDAEVMQAVVDEGGIGCAVADARPEIRAIANYHCPSNGGYGAVRDVCDRILENRPS